MMMMMMVIYDDDDDGNYNECISDNLNNLYIILILTIPKKVQS